MKNHFDRWNNIIGWAMFAVAAIVYLLTMQRTASWWDCGEYISGCYKLEVLHPPGNPTFQLIGRVFTLFAGSDVTNVALMINTMSALCSGFTILFLFWSITLLGRKIIEKRKDITNGSLLAVFGAGIIGSLTYTFTDTFWFSAVEGEVYAMSSFFTALVFWAMLRWEREADSPNAPRWIILIFFLIGLAIGVHLLNILTIPALTYIYYYKKYNRHDWKGWFVAGLISIALIVILMFVIIPWTVKLAGYFELFFVNTCHLPFNSGTIIYFALLIGLIVFSIWLTEKKQKAIRNTIVLCFTVLLIGYSTFFMVIIRANETLPINMNEPKDALSLVSYLNRDQYGSFPLLYGQYYNSPIAVDRQKGRASAKESSPIYSKDSKTGRYEIVNYGFPQYNYEPEFCTIFPRMYSSSQENHVEGYKEWGKIKGKNIKYDNPFTGKSEVIKKPTFGENLRFFFSYQVMHMYWRYFMWNFSGRQNDIEGAGSPLEGNWITGINAFDKGHVGSNTYKSENEDGIIVEKKMPESMNNIAHNTYYLLPFILGLLGLVFHIYKDSRDTWIVFLLFFMTGVAIVLYLNQTPYQPRERDYAYAGSFYAFCIWLGFSVMAVTDWLKKYAPEKIIAPIATVLFLGVPLLMAQQNWDDHDRSKNYAEHDFGIDYLISCPPNAILYTNGDNDTYPLWYAQEVEGIRTDVRVINYQLSNGAWYANQMSHKINKSEKLPLSLTPEQYKRSLTDYVTLKPQLAIEVPAKEVIDFINNPKNEKNLISQGIPTKKIYFPINKQKMLDDGLITESEFEIIGDKLSLEFPRDKAAMYKHEILLLDLMATNNWERPICFTSPSIIKDFLPLDEYFHLVGSVYQLLPYKRQINNDVSNFGVRVDTAYNFFMNKYLSGGLEKPDVNIDRESMMSTRFPKQEFLMLARTLQKSGDTARTIAIADRCQELLPIERFPMTNEGSYTFIYSMMLSDCYLAVGAKEKGTILLEKGFNILKEELEYLAYQKHLQQSLYRAIYQRLYYMSFIGEIAQRYELLDLVNATQSLINDYQKRGLLKS